jgi:hypothetical protein
MPGSTREDSLLAPSGDLAKGVRAEEPEERVARFPFAVDQVASRRVDIAIEVSGTVSGVLLESRDHGPELGFEGLLFAREHFVVHSDRDHRSILPLGDIKKRGWPRPILPSSGPRSWCTILDGPSRYG